MKASLSPYLLDCLRRLVDIETAETVPQSACDKLEALGLYSDRGGGVTDSGRRALASAPRSSR
jgi:hypothetical protein